MLKCRIDFVDPYIANEEGSEKENCLGGNKSQFKCLPGTLQLRTNPISDKSYLIILTEVNFRAENTKLQKDMTMSIRM